MTKKTLNLEISDLEQLGGNKPTVSLMPCPCGASGGGSMPDSVDLFDGKSLYDMFKDIYPEKAKEFEHNLADSLFGLFGLGDDTTGSDADFAAINAEIEANESQAGGGGK